MCGVSISPRDFRLRLRPHAEDRGPGRARPPPPPCTLSRPIEFLETRCVDRWIAVASRAEVGGMSFLDHPESHSCVESRSRHEIFVFGFDYTQKIGVWRGHPPAPPLSPWPTASDKCLRESRVETLGAQRGGAGGEGGALPGPVSSACGRSRTPTSRGGPEWCSGMRLSVVPGERPPPHPLREVTGSATREVRGAREFRGRERAGRG